MKNPGVAAVLSFFITGLGHIYNGMIGKGILLFLIQLVNIGLTSILVGYVTFFIVWIYAIVDAYKSAERINAGSSPKG